MILEKKTYERQELIDFYKTNRLDAIKNKLKRDGYIYTEEGRGKSYQIKIQQIPDSLVVKDFLICRLGFSSQTNFQNLCGFLYHFLMDDSFQSLQYNEMAAALEEEGFIISAATISKYCEQLLSKGWRYYEPTEFVYYYYDNETEKNIYIDKDTYCKAYREYYKLKEDKGYWAAEDYIFREFGTKPKKRHKYSKNGFYNKEYQELIELLEKGVLTDG